MLFWQHSPEKESHLSRFYLGFRKPQECLCLHKAHKWKAHQYTKGGDFGEMIIYIMRTISSRLRLMSLQRPDETCLLPPSPCEDTGRRHQLWEMGPSSDTISTFSLNFSHSQKVRNIRWFFISNTVRGVFVLTSAANGLRRSGWFGPCHSTPSSPLSNCSVRVAWRHGATWKGTHTHTSRSTNHTTEITGCCELEKQGITSHILSATQLLRCVPMISRVFPREAINLNVKLSAFENWIN